MAGKNINVAEIFARHPLPWRVTEEFKQWNIDGGHRPAPNVIVDAAFDDHFEEKFPPVAARQANQDHVILSCSEWLYMETDVVEMIVALVNSLGSKIDPSVTEKD